MGSFSTVPAPVGCGRGCFVQWKAPGSHHLYHLSYMGPGWSHAWVLHGPEGCAVVSLNICHAWVLKVWVQPMVLLTWGNNVAAYVKGLRSAGTEQHLGSCGVFNS